jgi:hypothetical protein
MPTTSYGHLIILAARHARLRLDGHAVVNRATRAPIALTWERGLKETVAPGTPPEMLLAVPAIPAMLAGARYLGSAPDPLHQEGPSLSHKGRGQESRLRRVGAIRPSSLCNRPSLLYTAGDLCHHSRRTKNSGGGVT